MKISTLLTIIFSIIGALFFACALALGFTQGQTMTEGQSAMTFGLGLVGLVLLGAAVGGAVQIINREVDESKARERV